MSQDHDDSNKPTVRTLYYLLGCIAHRWRALGVRLKLRDEDLHTINADHQSCSRRLIELFDLWMECFPDCTWSTIVKALLDMGEEALARKVDHYTKELRRIENRPVSSHCRRLVPMKEFCYEDWALEKVYLDCDKLSRTSILDHKREIFDHLLPRRTSWYELGIVLGVPKAKLDEIKNQYRLEAVALIKMVEELIEKFSFECSWRMVIDALEAMNFNTVVRSVEDLAKTKVKYEPAYATTSLSEYRRSNFTLENLHLTEEPYKDQESQENIQIIRSILGLSPYYFSDEDIMTNLSEHLIIKNPSPDQLILITSVVKKIGELSSTHSKEIPKQAKRLNEEKQSVEKVMLQLKKQIRELKITKGKLEIESRLLGEQIKKINIDGMRDELLELEKRNQAIQTELKQVCKDLKNCFQKLRAANADYNAINEQLSACRLHLHTCKSGLVSCQEYLNQVFKRERNIPLPPEIRSVAETISESLKELKEAEAIIRENQTVLDVMDFNILENVVPLNSGSLRKTVFAAALHAMYWLEVIVGLLTAMAWMLIILYNIAYFISTSYKSVAMGKLHNICR